VLDFVFTVRLAANEGSDYIMVLEDDTPAFGDVAYGVTQCIAAYRNTSTACRWDFHWEKKTAAAKVVARSHPLAQKSPKLMYPQGNLQGLFAIMLPAADWVSVCDYMRLHFDKAPADWLIGRWLFQQNWRIAFMPPVLAVYHCSGANFKSSSRLAVSRQLSDDPLFTAKALDWNACPRTGPVTQPFKWEDPQLYKLRWVGGEEYFLEVPWTDMEGHDIGVPRDAALMDEDARLIVCEMTPNCRAINLSGWMKVILLFFFFPCFLVFILLGY
jgi:hypothetical protein